MTVLDAMVCLELSPTSQAKHWPAFKRYHLRLPGVYDLFVRFTVALIQARRRHCGAHLIVNRLRWESAINPERLEGYKISNCTFPFYARLFMTQYPEHRGFFRTKRLRAADGTLIDEQGAFDAVE